MANEEVNEKPKIVIPLLHLNGSGYDNLIKLRMDVYVSVKAALNTLCQMAPHARDYYIAENHDELYEQARVQHRKRLDVLKNLMRDISTEAEMLNTEHHKQTR